MIVSPARRPAIGWFAAYAVCALASALPLLLTYRLPMADLPQHAAQTAILKFFDHPCYQFAHTYELNWRTPYLLGTLVTLALSSVAGIAGGLKLAVYLSIVTLPLALRRVARYAGLDPWLALLGFPLAFGFSFYWGFLTFLLTLPIVLLALTEVHEATDRPPGAAKLAWICTLSLAAAAFHALAYCALAAIALPAIVARARRPVRALATGVAIAAPIPLLAWWMFSQQQSSVRAHNPWVWDLGPGRLTKTFEYLLSPGGDGSALLLGFLLVALVLISGVRRAHDPTRWIAPAVALALCLFAPMAAFGQSFLYQRFGILAFGSLLLALEPGTNRLRPPAVRALIVLVVLSWMAVLSVRFRAFHRDADGFDTVVDAVPANQRLLLLNALPGSEAVPGMVFVHFSGYYQERKGGTIGWSFASNFPPVVRYRPEIREGVPPYVTYDPRAFKWSEHSNYRYFVVRAPIDLSPLVFRDAPRGAIRLNGHSGQWWLYERTDRPGPKGCLPLSPDREHRPWL